MTFNFMKIRIVVFVVMVASCPSLLVAQNTSHSERLKVAVNEENAKTLVACSALIGRTFWYKPSVTSEPMFIRSNDNGNLPTRAYWKDMRIENETSFVVVGCTPNEGNTFSLFKVLFPDESFGYLVALDYSERRLDEFSVMNRIYSGSDKQYTGMGNTSAPAGHIYAGPPQQVFDAERKIATEKEVKAAASLKARGGVRIGMSATQVFN